MTPFGSNQARQRPPLTQARGGMTAGTSAPDPVNIRQHRPDYVLLLLMLVLLAVGTVVVYSIGPAMAEDKGTTGNGIVTRQLIAVGVGLLAFFVCSRIPFSFWKHAAMPLLVVAGVLTLITLILPVNAEYPAHRWIRLGGFSFQSVEVVKLALLAWAAGLLAYRQTKEEVNNWHKTLKLFVFTLVGVGIIVAGLQSDFGSTVVIVAMMLVLLIAAGLKLRYVATALAALAIGALLLIAPSDYRRDRIATFVNPERDCAAAGYQSCQALIAVGSGGMIGLGLGNSVQAYGYLPEAENDSIFAIYAEKFGFLGVAVLLGLLVTLYTRLKRIADRAPDEFSRFFVLGVLVWLSVQAIMNIGAMLGLLPLKGITLPLISYGGSSVLVIMAVLGIVFQVSRYTNMNRQSSVERGSSHDDSGDRRRVRGARYATYSGRR